MASSFYVTPRHRKGKGTFFLHFLKHLLGSLCGKVFNDFFSCLNGYSAIDTSTIPCCAAWEQTILFLTWSKFYQKKDFDDTQLKGVR